MSPDTVWAIMNKSDNVQMSYPELMNKMVCFNDNIGFSNFLDKFKILDNIEWSEWAIDFTIDQVCRDISKEEIKYSEISLSLNKYNEIGDLKDIALFINESFKKYSDRYGIQIGLLLSLRYNSSRDLQIEISNIIDDKSLRDIFIGIDLVGDESYFDVGFYKTIFDKWRMHDKILRAHVGEMPGTCDNVIKAISILKATRIAHGIQGSNDAFDLAAKSGVCFDLALHSNLTTGAVYDIMNHPIRRMLNRGCIVTLNTDDPIQFSCSLDDEYLLALNYGLLTLTEANDIMTNSYNAIKDTI